ncbi:hypothetical protein AVEN_170027-1, partial [Araneus ventricosus]
MFIYLSASPECRHTLLRFFDQKDHICFRLAMKHCPKIVNPAKDTFEKDF